MSGPHSAAAHDIPTHAPVLGPPADDLSAALLAGHRLPEQLTDRMGIVFTAIGADEVAARMPVAGNKQPYGLLHGGANAVLAETLGSVLAAQHAGPGRAAVGLELSCTHHRAVTEGEVTGSARPIHLGRATATVEIVVVDGAGRRTCTARLTCVLRDAAPR